LPQFILFALDVSHLVCPCLSAWWLKLRADVLLVVLLFLNLLLDLSPSPRNSQLPIVIWDANLFVQDSGISSNAGIKFSPCVSCFVPPSYFMIVLSKNCTPYHQALKILRALDSLHFPCKVNSSLSSEVKFGFPGTGGFLMISVPPNAKGWARNGLT